MRLFSALIKSEASNPDERRTADYFLALCHLRDGKIEEAASVLNTLVETGHAGLKARALVSLGGVCYLHGRFKESAEILMEAERAASCFEAYDPFALVTARRTQAMISSQEGNIELAIRSLESLVETSAKEIGGESPAFFDCANSLAVELCQAGFYREALRYSSLASSSPLSSVYPEWHDTHAEAISLQINRSRVASSSSEDERLLYFPKNITRPKLPPVSEGPGRIVSIEDYRRHSTSESDEQSIERLRLDLHRFVFRVDTTRQGLVRALRAIHASAGWSPESIGPVHDIFDSFEASRLDLQCAIIRAVWDDRATPDMLQRVRDACMDVRASM